jgi:hypothetical protein
VFGFGEKVGIFTGGDPATTLVPLSNQVAAAFANVSFKRPRKFSASGVRTWS